MKGVFLARTRSTKNNQTKTKALAISAGHSSRRALQTSDDSEDDELELDINEQAAKDTTAHDKEGTVVYGDETGCGPSEPTEYSLMSRHSRKLAIGRKMLPMWD